jgi:ATP-dependent DNA helicase RecQ
MTNSSTADGSLQTFGLSEFRPGQERVIQALRAGRSALAIFPTGAGKSLCYQLPALEFDGLTIVVSPLLSLMKDQVDALRSKGLSAERLDSTLGLDETRRVAQAVRAGTVKLLYVSPERFSSERFRAGMAGKKLSLLAVDEAHCISEWGHNFRPDYLKLASHAKELRAERILALTATAPPKVAAEIAVGFGIEAQDVVNLGVYRPNLTIHATPCTAKERPNFLLDRLRSRPRGATIVYATLQKTAEEVARLLASQGLPARAYHGGMKPEEREAVQDWFIGRPDAVVAATIAFGMGIDKADLRYVYHYNLPKAVENYTQEIGRAGRDGEPATCEIFSAADDVTTLENFAYGDTPTAAAVEGMLREAFDSGDEIELSMYDLSGAHDIRPLVAETLLVHLELAGMLEATGTKFAEVQFVPLRSSKEILEGMNAERSEFLRGVFKSARKASKWFRLDVDAAAAKLNQPRQRIMTALDYLAERGDLTLKTAGARQCYRVLKRPQDRAALVELLLKGFRDRERRDVERTRMMFEFSQSPGCLHRRLGDYFGEARESDCGHCGWCLGERTEAPTASAARDLARIPDAIWSEPQSPALASSRQRTRFLCGIASPAAGRLKLGRHPNFGALAEIPFGTVMRKVQEMNRAPAPEGAG